MAIPVVKARPRRATVVCWLTAIVVVVLFSAIAVGLGGQRQGRVVFEVADQVAMAGLGLLVAAGILAFTRPRVVADARGIRVRNLVGSYDLPWNVVRAVRFDRGAPWASLELVDDDMVAVMAVQAADKEYAVSVVRELRALLAASRQPESES